MSLRYHEVAPILAGLEKKFQADIAELKVEGWSLWPILRIRIAHSLLPSDPPNTGQAIQTHAGKERRRVRLLYLRSFFELIFLILRGGARKKVMTRTLTYNRRETWQNKKYCVFFDQLIQDMDRKHFIVSEGRGFEPHRYERDVPNKVDFHDDFVVPLARLFSPWMKYRLRSELSNLKRISERIHPGSSDSIADTALDFAKKYHAWRWIYRLLKPESVLVSVAPYKREAEIAALRSLGIPVYEYQHGEMTSYDLSYCYSPAMKNLKAVLPIPDRMFLFGKQQEQVFLDAGFWPRDQLEVTGTPQIYSSERRGVQAYPYDPAFLNVLVTPSALQQVPSGLRDFIGSYIESTQALRYRFYIKPHPSERHEDWFEFAEKYRDRVFVVSGNLHSLIKGAHVQLGVFTSCFHEGFHWNLPAYVLKAGPWEMALPLIHAGSARLIPTDFRGEFERFEVPALERDRFMTVDPVRLKALLFRSHR